MLRGTAWLALLLAGLSASQMGVWASDETLWYDAVRTHPTAPVALINLGAFRMRGNDLLAAEVLFQQADRVAGTGSAFDYAWTRDVLEANWAVLNIRRGQFYQAAARLREAPAGSTRAAVCRQFLLVCQLRPV